MITKLPADSYETGKMATPLVRNFVKVVNKRLLDVVVATLQFFADGPKLVPPVIKLPKS